MDDGDDGDDGEESDKVLRDVKELEGMLEEELEEVLKLAKPVRQVLYKVSLGSIILDCRLSFFFWSIPVSLLFFLNPSFYLSPFFYFLFLPSIPISFW